MGKTAAPLLLNLGCGFVKKPEFVNVDAYGDPDVWWDLNITPYPWADNSVDGIEMFHVLEHLENWWDAFRECGRILKPGGYLRINLPDASSDSALTYRDHVRAFNELSFHGIVDARHGTNAWAATEQETVPLRLVSHLKVPFERYAWMHYCPPLLRWCANHLRNFIWEQQFEFRKVGPDRRGS